MASSSTTLPNAKLEAYFMVPLQITKHLSNKEVDAEQLYKHLEDSHCWCPVHDHELDDIGSASNREGGSRSHYFHPFVQNFWFSDEKEPEANVVRRFRHTLLHCLSVNPNKGKTKIVDIEFDAACDLLHFKPDILILCLHVRSREIISYGNMLDCLNQLRRLYPSSFMLLDKSDTPTVSGGFPNNVGLFQEQGQELARFANDDVQKLYEQTNTVQGYGRPWAEHWAYLLAPLGLLDGNNSPYQITQLGDDRAAIVALTQLDFSEIDSADTEQRPHPIIGLNEAAMTRLCLIDPANDLYSSPYSRHFLQQTGEDIGGQTPFEKHYCYDRFWYKEGESSLKPSRMMNCGYAYIWLGPLDDRGYFANEKSGAPKVFRNNYVPMALIAHFQQAKLITLMNQLSRTVKGNDWDEDKLQQCQQDFIHFTQTYWFSEITHQEQGLEMFAMWRQHLRLNTLYDEIRAQLQDVMTHVQSKQTERLNQRLMFFTVVSLLLAGIGVSTGILGINIFDGGMLKEPIQGKWLYNFLVTYSWLIPTAVVLLVLIFLYLDKLKRGLCFIWKHLIKLKKAN